MATRTVCVAGFVTLLLATAATAQSLKTGPAPGGAAAAAVAALIIKEADHPCPKVTRAKRLKDGSITATCSNGETYRVATLSKRPFAMKCSAAKALGISGC